MSTSVPTLLDVKETARRLGVSVSCVRRLIYKGKLRHVKIGSRVLLEPEEINHFLQECTRPRTEGNAKPDGAE